MAYLKLHTAIYIEGVIEERHRPNEKSPKPDLIFKPKGMKLLGNVTEELVKGFSIYVSTPMLNPEFREKLVKMLKRNKGKVPLTMFLYDPQKKWNIEFLSHKFKVQISQEFIQELKSLGINYAVTRK